MYQFTTTTLINSNLDSNGTTAKYAGTATAFNVTRVGKFLADNIVSVNKRAYSAGVKEVATVTVPAITLGLVARLEIDIRLAQQTYSDYANTYLYFKKPQFVEIISSGVANTDAAALVAELNKLKDRFGYSYVTATVSGADITVTATDFNQRFHDIIISKSQDSYNSIIQPEYVDITAGTFAITTEGKLGFGDDDWMARSIVMPTYENSRAFGISKDEKPILGGNYTQYTLRYSIDKEGGDGIVASGKSITTHVFYVLSTLQAAFEAALQTTYPGIITIGGAGSIIISGDEVLDLSESETTTLTAANFVGTITWTSGTVGTATIDSSTGVVTAVGAGTTVITATDTATSTGTFTITVVA